MRKASEIATAFSDRAELSNAQRFFLVGIAGAGMSALARMLHHRGLHVLGTDAGGGVEMERLAQEGILAMVGHSGDKIEPGDAVILTDAIDLETSPEVKRARELGCGLFRRSQALGWLLKPYKVIAVTGTHGKTTTTGLTGAGLIAAGLDPVVVVGATIPEWGGPVREGKGDWAVVEACEAYDSFHDLDPAVVLLTNLELDHVDFHENWENLRASVARFVDRLPEGGTLVYCAEDPGACEIATLSKAETRPYHAVEAELTLPGPHNRLNAGGAVEVARAIGVEVAKVLEGASQFKGAERRLQLLHDGDIAVLDDYAHHPTEIRASISALRQRYEGRRIVVVFQPHLYSRTAEMIPEFAEALSLSDLAVVTDIYKAREDPMPGVSASRIVERLTVPAKYVPSRQLLPRIVASLTLPSDVVVGMGAGTITEFPPAFVKEWARNRDLGRKKRIAVVLGGDTSEREVSLHSGRAVLRALLNLGHDAYEFDVSDALLSKGAIPGLIGPNRPDLAFLAVHGSHLEGGGMQGLFELLHIPYTGSGIRASAVAMDKAATKRVLAQAGVPTPQGWEVGKGDPLPQEAKAPLIVKPNREGSTVGLSFVETQDQLAPAVERALTYDSTALIEEWVRGMEISVPVLGGKALPVVEIVPQSGHYDFAMKYLPGATEEIVPARLPEDVYLLAQQRAEMAHKALGCEGATRTDFLVRDGRDPVALEVNTLPGLTPTSLLPNGAKAAGMTFEDLVQWIVEDALARQAD